MKKFISLLAVLTLCISMATTAFATDGKDSSEIEKTTVTYEIEPGTELVTKPGESVDPCIWGQETHEPTAKVRYTTPFTIPDRYFAYEMTATSGNPAGEYAVALMDRYNTVTTSRTNIANGSTLKNDWITVDAGEAYQFRITNFTGSNLKVTLTYYSWK